AQRRGDYEAAEALLREACQRGADLSPTEKQELTRLLNDNAAALAGRARGREALRQAEAAFKAGHTADAQALVRKAGANERFLIAAARDRLGQLGWNTRTAQPAGGDPRLKVQQARAELLRFDLDAAEALAHEAAKVKVVYNDNDDTPTKVLRDVAHARTDP